MAAAQTSGLAEVVDLVAAWLPDRTPLAAVARFARCSAHFRSYLVSSASAAAFRCFACNEELRCVVARHRHFGAFVVFEGLDTEEWYAWQPAQDRVACWWCVERLGFSAAAWALEDLHNNHLDAQAAAALLDMFFEAL